MAITKVAVAGATGNLGPSIVNALLEAGFQVAVLSRSSSHQLDPRAQVKVVDYASLESITAAIAGQDALINTLAIGSIPGDVHLRLVEAAHAAGVQRFLPSEFGSDTANPLAAKLPPFADKIAVVQRLKELSAANSAFSYTSLVTGPFFDWGIQHKFIINLSGPSTRIFDGGDVPFSGTTLSGIGRAVVGVLKHPAETQNRHVYVADAEVTQNQILRWSGKEGQIERVPVKTEDLELEAYEIVKQPNPDFGKFAVNLITRAIFGGKYGGRFARTDNELLGVSRLTEAQIVEIVKHNA